MEQTLDMRYRRSQEMLQRALRTIPLASQTFSKSITQYPANVSPHFAIRAKGSRLWDADGNEYLDFVNALAAVTLGYCDPDVNRAVAEQIEQGTIFTLPHPLEFQVAEMIVDMVPCAEMVRFGKNGSDATAGAIRLARAYTARDHVAACGYHGWQDWYIGSTTRSLGVPVCVRNLTHTFIYNDIESLHRIMRDHPGQVAAVIMEPMNITEPKNGFLQSVAELTRINGALFIFDETITGFRFANGGAQQYFGVIPDLATFGKGLANGFPVSAIAGRQEIMRLMEEIFFSFTFGGEALSLAAAEATLRKLIREPVIEIIWARGNKLVGGVRSIISKNGLTDVLDISGKPCWSFLIFKDFNGCSSWDLKTLFLQEIFRRGVLSIGTHNMSYAHSEEDIDRLLAIYSEVLPILGDAVSQGNVRTFLKTDPLIPLFKIR